jgi:glc operon protein GlcG
MMVCKKKFLTFFTGILLLNAVSFSQDLTGPVMNPESLSLDVAKRAALAAEKKAKDMGFSVGIVVLDQSGSLKLAHLMDKQSIISLDWAKAKALTAYEFRKPTNRGEFKVWNIGGETLILGASGGMPLNFKGRTLGAIGVSGTKEDADDIIARAGVEEFQKIMNR